MYLSTQLSADYLSFRFQVRQEYERVVEEKERILNEFAEQQKVKSEAEKERKQLRSEVRELKLRETRLLTDYSELEEENITLQKQVSGLKSSQVSTLIPCLA